MQAAIVTGPGTEPVFGDFPEPPGADDGPQPMSLVGAGVHQVTRAVAAGSHYSSQGRYPLVPGLDAVARTADGRLVYTGWPTVPWGTMAERMPTTMGIDLPPGADPLAVAAGMNPGMSGWLVLRRQVAEDGDLATVVILGATGMSGTMATQAALDLGAGRVITIGRDRAALERLAGFGAHPVRLTDLGSDPVLRRAVRGPGAVLVLDYLWGSAAEALFALLATGSEKGSSVRHVQIGSLAGGSAGVPAELLRSRRITVEGSGLGSISPQQALAEIPEVIARIADGRLSAPYTAYPLDRVDRAWRHTGRDRAVVVPTD